MKRILLSSTIAATLLCSTTHIMAADYDQGVVTKTPAETYTDVEFGSGWYIRGDITFNSRGKSENTITGIGDPSDTFNLQADYDDVIGARVGFGYQVNDFLRLDATVSGTMKGNLDGFRSQGYGGARNVEITDAAGNTQTDTVYFNSEGQVTSNTTGAYTGTTIAPINGTDDVKAEYSVSNFIVNGYLDLPLSERIVPYVGAGAGFARVNYNETRKLNCIADSSSACNFPAGNFGESTEVELYRDEEFWAFAYQFSVGTALKLTNRTSVDVGYTYLNVADGDQLTYENGLAINEDGFAIHQGHVGFRYDIN